LLLVVVVVAATSNILVIIVVIPAIVLDKDTITIAVCVEVVKVLKFRVDRCMAVQQHGGRLPCLLAVQVNDLGVREVTKLCNLLLIPPHPPAVTCNELPDKLFCGPVVLAVHKVCFGKG
jgi:hypothetical protein